MNYEFHVGDYVKTIGGFVGWISNIKDNNYIVITDENNNSCGYYLPQEETYFVRIGAYDFTKKEKKKIEALTINKTMSQYTGDGTSNTASDYTTVYENVKFQDKVIDKINELVDAVNLLLDKSTKS
mgnify:CR=1 FL=1